MKSLEIYNYGILAGVLTEEAQNKFLFHYNESYYNDPHKPAISLTLPKTQKEYTSEYMFPFFSNMIAEGTNLEIQTRYLKIDQRDVFSLLAATATSDTIGAITVKMISQK